MSAEAKPLARAGLLASDHSKRGRRYVTILDPRTSDVTLLEAWEHAVLSLCNGARTIATLTELLPPDIEGQVIDANVVRRCLKFFEREKLIVNAGLRSSDLPPPGPVTMNEMSRAYAEWHKSPNDREASTGLAPPIPRTSPKIPAGLGPTVAQGARKGSLPGMQSLIDDDDAGEPMPDLMAAVDDAMAEAGRVVEKEQAKKARKKVDTKEIVEAESRPLVSGVHRPPAGGVMVSATLAAASPLRPMSSTGTPTAPVSPMSTMRLSDLLAADATEPATILLSPKQPEASVRLLDKDAEHNEPTGPMAKSDHALTQLGPLVRGKKK